MKISVVGATAYTSRELLKLLARHPEAEVVHLGGRREGNPPISDIFSALKGICDMRLSGLHPQDAPTQPDVAFFTLPHGLSQQFVPEYLDAGVRCIDFSADYRLDDLDVYAEWYGEHADPDNVARAVYGIPELWREQVRDAQLVANPGCYPTGVTIGLAPLVQHGLIDPAHIIVDAKSGVSGRGNKPSEGSMYCECNEDLQAYKVTGHRHEPEMERALKLAGGTEVNVTFVPHLAPMDRGIQSTIYVPLAGSATGEELQQALEDAYADEPFVRVRSADAQPRTKDVAFTNCCDVEAVQNMNAMFGLDETMGLL